MHILRLKEEVRKSQAARKRGLFDPPPTRLDRGTNPNRHTVRTSTHDGWLKPERVAIVRHFLKAGVVDAGWSRVMPRKGRQGVPGKGKDPAANAERALRRTKRQIRRKCLALGVDRILTLTLRENVTDLKTLDEMLARFVRVMRQDFPGYQLVGVPERHHENRNGYHFHAGMVGFHDVKIVRRCWRKAATGDAKSPDANIDIAFEPDGKGNHEAKTASYMSKYIGKDLFEGHELNAKRYRVSVGIEVPRERVTLKVWTDACAQSELRMIVQARLGEASTHEWMGDGYGWIYCEEHRLG